MIDDAKTAGFEMKRRRTENNSTLKLEEELNGEVTFTTMSSNKAKTMSEIQKKKVRMNKQSEIPTTIIECWQSQVKKMSQQVESVWHE